MKITVTVSVRNPEWYWSDDEIKRLGEGYYKEWMAVNETKVQKHSYSWTCEIGFNVKEISEIREGEVQINVKATNGEEDEYYYLIKDATVLDFIGEGISTSLAISNSLIHQYIGAKKRGYKYYIYFYLKADTPCDHVEDLIWIARSDPKEFKDKPII